MKPERITKIHHIISELDIQILRFQKNGDEHSVKLLSDVRSDYFDDLEKLKISS